MLAVLKALGDETRFSMYRELASSTHPLSAHDLADRLGIHANTVRLHLERLREAGLVDVEAVHRGTVGRPQHVYSLAPGAPGLGFDPPSYTLLAGLLGRARRAHGRRCRRSRRDRAALGRRGRPPHPLPLLRQGARVRARTARLRPGAQEDDGEVSIAFLHCPFRELAEAYPELVCNLHRGICEGVVKSVGGGSVEDFATLYDHDPCRVTVAVGYPEDA